MRSKVVYIISDTEKSLGFEWTAMHFAQQGAIQFIIIGRAKTPLEEYISTLQVPCHLVTDEAYPSTIAKLFRVYSLLKGIKPDVIHCHLWHASLIGLSTAYLLGIKRRIFTRHHSMIHYNEFKKGRKWDKLCNYLATDIVAISENVKKVVVEMDNANPRKVHVIHHGFDLDYFQNVSGARVSKIRQLYIINSKHPVVGIISRYLELKGIQYIIPAFKKLVEVFPNAHLVLANAGGNFQKHIQKLLKELPANSFTEIPFEEDLAALYQTFDIFVHAPIDSQREAFGQTYVEALAGGIPSVFTLSGVAPEFVVHEENALVVPFCNSESIYDSILRILNDTELRNRLIASGKKSANQFPLSRMVEQLSQLYDS